MSRWAGRRTVAWAGMAVLLVGALLVGVTDESQPRTVDQRTHDLASSIMCPTCAGQSAADSDAPAARGIRAYIEERIVDGAGDDQIRDELASAYGEQILLAPKRSGVAGLVWVLPVVALVVALAGVALAFRRWRGRGALRPSPADRELVDRARTTATDGGP